MVKGLSDTTKVNTTDVLKTPEQSNKIGVDLFSLPGNFPLAPVSKNIDLLNLKKNDKPAIISEKMKHYIKKSEAGERHISKDGRYVVYYGKADKAADLKNKEKEPLLTVGHGHSQRGKITVGYRDLKEGDVITHYQADKLFEDDIQDIQDKLANNEGCTLTKKLAQCQSDALISYGFNAGVDKFCIADEKRDVPESMVECLNKGEIGKAQSKFNIITAGGVIQPGLAKRRMTEMIIFGNGKIYPEAEATFKKVKDGISGYKRLKMIYDINQALKEYGINDKDRKRMIQRIIY